MTAWLFTCDNHFACAHHGFDADCSPFMPNNEMPLFTTANHSSTPTAPVSTSFTCNAHLKCIPFVCNRSRFDLLHFSIRIAAGSRSPIPLLVCKKNTFLEHIPFHSGRHIWNLRKGSSWGRWYPLFQHTQNNLYSFRFTCNSTFPLRLHFFVHGFSIVRTIVKTLSCVFTCGISCFFGFFARSPSLTGRSAS